MTIILDFGTWWVEYHEVSIPFVAADTLTSSADTALGRSGVFLGGGVFARGQEATFPVYSLRKTGGTSVAKGDFINSFLARGAVENTPVTSNVAVLLIMRSRSIKV